MFTQMQLPRISTRRWLTVVLIVGMAMGMIVGGLRLRQRHNLLLSLAQLHKERAAFYRKLETRERKVLADLPNRITVLENLSWQHRRDHLISTRLEDSKVQIKRSNELLVRWTGRIAHEEMMVRKYDHAAHYPWRPVEPDLPQSE
jgi:type II secretory pathway component PulK